VTQASQKRETRPTTGRAARLVALFALGFLLLNNPLLSLVDGHGTVAGLPLVYVYIFTIWAGLIAATALITRRRQR